MKVILTVGELHLAAQNGCLRQIESMSRNLPDKHGFDGPGWNIHVEGAAGEIAAAKALNMYWGGTVNTFKSIGDIGKLEIRTTSVKNNRLIVRNKDSDDAVFVLVVGSTPTFEVVGWMLGKDAKQSKYVSAPGGRPPAYFVPREDLNSLDTLK